MAVGKQCVFLNPFISHEWGTDQYRIQASLLLGLVSLFVYRAVRDAVPNPASQERVIGAVIAALGVGDVSVLYLTCTVSLLT